MPKDRIPTSRIARTAKIARLAASQGTRQLGTQAANLAVQESDLLICVGARFDDRATGKLAEFAPHAKVIHLDGDVAEIGKLRAVHAALHGDLREGLQALSDVRPDCKVWRNACTSRARKTAARCVVTGAAGLLNARCRGSRTSGVCAFAGRNRRCCFKDTSTLDAPSCCSKRFWDSL